MGPAMKIQSQVNKELIELSEKNNTASTTSKERPSTPADKEEDDDDDGEGDTGTEGVIEANADEDESDEYVDVESEAERAMNAEVGEEEEEEEEEGGEDSDDMEEDGAEEEDEQEELSSKPAKIGKKRVVTSKKRHPPKKMGRGPKGIELIDPKVNDSIAGNSIKPTKTGIPERKRKVVQFAADSKVDKKRGVRTGKRAV